MNDPQADLSFAREQVLACARVFVRNVDSGDSRLIEIGQEHLVAAVRRYDELVDAMLNGATS